MLEELEATMRELEAQVPSALPEMRPLMLQQIDSMQQVAKMLRDALPAIEEMKHHRRPLSPALAAFFQPDPPAQIPSWIPDGVHRSEITEASMRAPPESRIYWSERWIGCAVPGMPGRSLGSAHGLSLHFRSTGRLADQCFYDRGLLRWCIAYHVLGGRESSGFYASTEPKTYLEHGLVTRWSANGTVLVQANFVAGRKHGWEKLWGEDGHPIVAMRWVDGRNVEEVLPDASSAV
jgi:hypothetical protein